MKRVLRIVCIALMLVYLVGCSQEAINQKSEEELRQELKAELKAELEAEMTATENDLSKGFTYKVENGDLKLTYNNTGNTVTLIKAFGEYKYTQYTDTGTATHDMQFPEIIKAQLSLGEQEIYFTVGPIHGLGITSYFIELKSMDIYFISQGKFVEEVKWDRFSTMVVLEDSYGGETYYYAGFPRGGWEGYHLGSQLEKDILTQIERAIHKKENEPLDIYETNKEYKLYDLDQQGTVDTFKVVQSNSELYLIVNDRRFDIHGIGIELPELVFHKYKIIKHTGQGDYAFVFSEADPPNEPDKIQLYRYSPGYAMEYSGFVIPHMNIQDLYIDGMDFSTVTIHGTSYPLQNNL